MQVNGSTGIYRVNGGRRPLLRRLRLSVIALRRDDYFGAEAFASAAMRRRNSSAKDLHGAGTEFWLDGTGSSSGLDSTG